MAQGQAGGLRVQGRACSSNRRKFGGYAGTEWTRSCCEGRPLVRMQMDKLVKQKTAEREAALKEEFDGKVKAYKERYVGEIARLGNVCPLGA